jgi:hypothetical protein
MINIFNVFDFSFVYWIAFGAVTVLVVLGANVWLKDRKIPMNFWKWIVLVLWYIAALMGIGAPFTIMGENEVAAGWRMFAFNIPIIIISGFIVYRIIALGRKKLVQ